MLSIYKYKLAEGPGKETALRIPLVKPLGVMEQGNGSVLYAIIDTELTRDQFTGVTLSCEGTGLALDRGCMSRQYIGTTKSGRYVWHWFLTTEPGKTMQRLWPV